MGAVCGLANPEPAAARVIVPWIDGRKVAIRHGMKGATGNVYAGLQEFADMMFLLHLLREGDLFLDIGANIGSYAVLASGVCRSETWAFEPDPSTRDHLERNVSINDLDGLITVFGCALGAARGDVPFTIGRDAENRVATDRDENVRIVRQERLDDLLGDASPTMAKIDVEGYEEEVLRGAGALLAKPSLIAVELETVTPEIETMMRDNGFGLAHYDPFRRRISRETCGFDTCNQLFVRDNSDAAERVATARRIDILGHSI